MPPDPPPFSPNHLRLSSFPAQSRGTPTFFDYLTDDDRLSNREALEGAGLAAQHAVGAQSQFPWNAICRIRCKWNGEFSDGGTGFFIGPGTIVTAGHVLFQHDRGWADEVEVQFSRRQESLSIRATELRGTAGWISRRELHADYGAILISDKRLTDHCGWFGVGVLAESALEQHVFHAGGFPINSDAAKRDPLPARKLFHASGRVAAVPRRRMSYSFYSGKGSSGSPLWIPRSDGHRFVVGIHHHLAEMQSESEKGKSFAVQITPEVYENFCHWIAEADSLHTDMCDLAVNPLKVE